MQKNGVTTDLEYLYATKDGWNRLVWSKYFTASISGTFYYGKTLTAYTNPSDFPVYGYQWCYATSTSGTSFLVPSYIVFVLVPIFLAKV